ncbi:MAG: hypothetical protein LDL31_05210 [Prosthecobacter sp.]|nr:hypothetical protein [Prosthecobacter sp.]
MLKTALTILTLSAAIAAHAGSPAPAATISPTVEPSEISYSNLSLSWLRQWAEVDGAPIDADSNGVALGLEFSPVKHLYLSLGGSWSNIEFSGPGGTLDGDYWTFHGGVGGWIPLADNIHFVTEVGGHYGQLDIDGGLRQNSWGVYVTPHIRAKFGALETHLGAIYNSNDTALADWSAFVRVLYEVCSGCDLFVTGTCGFQSQDFDSAFGLNVGLRVKF